MEVLDPATFSPSENGRSRRSSGSNSFEFCVLRKSNLLSADQLFSDGVLLPLHLLHRPSAAGQIPEPSPPDLSWEEHPELNRPELSGGEEPELASGEKQPDLSGEEKPELGPDPNPPESSGGEEPVLEPDESQPDLGPESGPEISAAVASSSATASTSSKRWRDIFKRGAKGGESAGEKVNRDKRGGIFGSNGVSAADRVLNINIWPFRRSNSAGNGGVPPAAGSGLTSPKVNSAPCSPGEFKAKKLPLSRKGRSNLAWPARRSVSGIGGRSSGLVMKSADKGAAAKDRNHADKSFKNEGNKGWGKVSPAATDGGGGDWYKARVLTMKASGGGGGGVSCEGRRADLRTLFTKKVYQI